ncbi:hypothetical protein L873DRAFT_755391 [Choiromyces venosus 120613-1]|uniref:Uncharacterized protein n=1 Tax=Choiromyces venosus 120613-1 TaxID=1336337 RepID=A0A3N4IS61_9PEZI|nr:hypothetical protein L873DRAFT_755391 [Choiromyces venosus 120613-1]
MMMVVSWVAGFLSYHIISHFPLPRTLPSGNQSDELILVPWKSVRSARIELLLPLQPLPPCLHPLLTFPTDAVSAAPLTVPVPDRGSLTRSEIPSFQSQSYKPIYPSIPNAILKSTGTFSLFLSLSFHLSLACAGLDWIKILSTVIPSQLPSRDTSTIKIKP